jgi:hypothetical protein
MNYRQRLSDIAAFLKPYQRIWQNEIMLLYPAPLVDYPADWVDELASITLKDEVICLERKEIEGLIHNPTLLAFYRQIEELTNFPLLPELPAKPEDSFTWLFVIHKKHHEIKRLAPLVNQEMAKLGITEIIDIGGGIGLLAQTLSNQYALKVSSLDMDPVLQQTGSERHTRNARHPHVKVTYHNVKVGQEETDFTKLLDADKMTLGLHTCGNLANEQIKASASHNVKSIINFGCCYQRLVEEETQNISGFARGLPEKIFMNHFALTLAARAHRKMDHKDYELKLKVKLYRYAMHILLHDEYGIHELLTLGNSSPKLYDLSFGEYAREQLGRVRLPLKRVEELNAFYQRDELKSLIWRMISAGLIRNALGRVLESYLLLDRVIYLQEQGYETELLECFNERTSPRNLGIVARRA